MSDSQYFSIDQNTLTCPSFVDMGLILNSISDLESAYNELKQGGFSRFILLPTEDNFLYQEKKFPGMIPAYAVVKDDKFRNLDHIHALPTGHDRYVFYQHTVYRSLHVAMAYQIMLKAKDMGALYISFPFNKTLAARGVIHEGIGSFKSGLPGISYLSEEVVVARDIELARATGCQLHFHQISTKRSVELIRRAKDEKLPVTCGTSAAHLLYTHRECEDFNVEYKIIPPLREEIDQESLIEGLKDGTIDTISTGHYTSDTSAEIYLHAPITALKPSKIFPTLFEKLIKTRVISLDTVLAALSTNPRRILGIPISENRITQELPTNNESN